MIDYTGKLNNHKQYIKIIDALEQTTQHIEIVLIDEKETNDLVEKFKSDIISKKLFQNGGEQKLLQRIN